MLSGELYDAISDRTEKSGRLLRRVINIAE
jgi:hypothetical protein